MDEGLRKTLTNIEKRPEMYLTTWPMIDALFNFLLGWKASMKDKDFNSYEENFFLNFQSFVAEELGDSRSVSWAKMIRERSANDPEAINFFFVLLKKFDTM